MLQPSSHCPFTRPLSPLVPERPSHWVLGLANYQGPLARSHPDRQKRAHSQSQTIFISWTPRQGCRVNAVKDTTARGEGRFYPSSLPAHPLGSSGKSYVAAPRPPRGGARQEMKGEGRRAWFQPKSKGSCPVGRPGCGLEDTLCLLIFPIQNKKPTCIPSSQRIQCSIPSVQG